jgi:hypothetical protein
MKDELNEVLHTLYSVAIYFEQERRVRISEYDNSKAQEKSPLHIAVEESIELVKEAIKSDG